MKVIIENEKVRPLESSQDSSSESPLEKNSVNQHKAKKLPNTGENSRNNLFFFGSIILSVLAFVFFGRRKIG